MADDKKKEARYVMGKEVKDGEFLPEPLSDEAMRRVLKSLDPRKKPAEAIFAPRQE